ncbi:acyltransferase [Streptomyces sp. 3MP-14]|uniref:Acyltransferase n=2 Tax=Streptomyces TaxID=1883 RepID=A0A5N6AMP0_9ACTN|nr:acyltransferase [Streptomyces mimosae]KAB8178699.1 acyltransferase [Streptomyces sp. 3MP-14]
MTRVRAHQEAERASGQHYSTFTCVLHSAARVLARHPEANAAIGGRLRPRVARYDAVNVKITLDKRVGGRRVVLSTVLPSVETATLGEIQKQVEHYRAGDPDSMPEFEGVRTLHRLPRLVGAAGFRRTVRPLAARARLLGTLAVTSLGHLPVDGFHSVGGTTVTLGLGRVVERPVVRDGQIVVAPVMRLNLAFDHRVIDGAEAGDILAEIRESLENFATEEVRA